MIVSSYIHRNVYAINYYQPLCVGAEFWYDRVVGVDDLEGSDGGDWQRVTHCRRPVWIHGASFSGIIQPWYRCATVLLPG